MKRKVLCTIGGVMLFGGLFGCGSDTSDDTVNSSSAVSTEEVEAEEVNLLIAAAASLEYSFEEKLIPAFEEANPTIKVEGTYDSSGKLQTQIEQGLACDLFFSAATKQMDELVDEEYIEASSVVDLLENKVVLIKGADTETSVTSFEDIVDADSIAIGDPESVPVGQYAEDIFSNIGNWNEILDKASLGTNVTEVLNWVAEGSAEVGVVYATDAATTDKVEVIAEAPEEYLDEKVVYPLGVLTNSENQDAAKLFQEFLQSDEALKIFEEYGFTPNN